MTLALLGLIGHRPIPSEGIGDPALVARAVDFVRKTGYPGVWIGEAKEGRLVGVACAGWADPLEDGRSRLDNGLRVGSVSKPFLASVVSEAVREGRIAYSDRLFDVVPEIRRTARPEYQGVTLEMLLTHTAGLVRNDALTRFDPPPTPAEYPALRLREAVAALETPPVSRPGTAYAYSNVGVETAAVMLERRLGEPYERLFERTVRGRLGLASAGIGEVASGRTAPFLLVHGRLEPSPRGVWWPYCYGPYGSVHVDIGDLVRFGLAQCGPSRLHAKVGPGDVTLSGFHRRGAVLCHNGLLVNDRGDSTQLWIDPAKRIVVAAYTNVGLPVGERGPAPNDVMMKALVEPLLARLRRRSG